MVKPSSTPKPLIIPVFIPHAGCPHRCIFCNQICTTGVKTALPEPHEINSSIEHFLRFARSNRRPIEISYFGGNFLGLEPARIKTLLGIAAAYIREGRVHGIRFSTRPDTVDAIRLDLIDPFPVSTVELGAQSMDDTVLLTAQRGHTAQDTRQAVALLKDRPYQIGLQMMVGLPGDSDAGIIDTGKQLSEMEPDFVRIYPTLVLESSLLAQWYTDKRYEPLTLERSVALVKTLHSIFTAKKIKVIRMGLQATTELNDKAVVKAGPFHPAFGELVYGAIFLDTLLAHLHSKPFVNNTLELVVHPRNLSRMCGHKRCNLDALRSHFNLAHIRVHTDTTLGANTMLVNGRRCEIPF